MLPFILGGILENLLSQNLIVIPLIYTQSSHFLEKDSSSSPRLEFPNKIKKLKNNFMAMSERLENLEGMFR